MCWTLASLKRSPFSEPSPGLLKKEWHLALLGRNVALRRLASDKAVLGRYRLQAASSSQACAQDAERSRQGPGRAQDCWPPVALQTNTPQRQPVLQRGFRIAKCIAPAAGLRPHLRIEMTFQTLRLPPVEPALSLIARSQRRGSEIPAFACVEPVETATDAQCSCLECLHGRASHGVRRPNFHSPSAQSCRTRAGRDQLRRSCWCRTECHGC